MSIKGSIVVTGVSTGIGYHVVKKFIEEGYQVFGSVRKEEDANKLKADFGALYIPLIFDVTDEESIKEAASLVNKTLNGEGLALLVNNSGIAVTGPSQMLPVDEFRRQFEVNFFGLIAVTNAFLPLLGGEGNSRLNSGKIINLSSVASTSGMPFMTPYGSSKAAVDAYSDGLRRELMVYGIDVVVFNPGAIETPIWGKVQEPTRAEQESVYGRPLKKFYKMFKKESQNAIQVDLFAGLVFKAFTARKPKIFNKVIKNKFLKYTLIRSIFRGRGYDNLLNKVLKLKQS
ncbi:MAG: SDR family NAD(P)-dependent oxidoreductase [Reichenbachiella sp.]